MIPSSEWSVGRLGVWCTSLVFILLSSITAQAAVINVPADQPTIAAGVAAALDFDTVAVAAGTYSESVAINKPLTLLGVDVATTRIQAPPTLSSAFTVGTDDYYPLIYANLADVTIRGFTMDGNGQGNANQHFVGIAFRNAGGSVEGCDIVDVRNDPADGTEHGIAIYGLADDGTPRTLDVTGCNISGFQWKGLACSGPDLTANVDGNTITGAGTVGSIKQTGLDMSAGVHGSFTNNNVSGFAYEPGTGIASAISVQASGSPVLTSGNTVIDAQIGIWYIDSEGEISENTIANDAINMGATPYWWCIVVDPGAAAPSAAGNYGDYDDLQAASDRRTTVSAGAAALTTLVHLNVVDGGGNGTGIEGDALGTETLNLTATENSVTNCEVGFFLYEEAGATLNGVIQYNRIAENEFALLNQTLQQQDAVTNWWGHSSGPRVATNPAGAGDSLSANVLYSPWFGTDDADLITPGYQLATPMHWYANQEGDFPLSTSVALSSSGDTISVLPGTYVDNLALTKSLALLGTDAATTTIYPAISDVGTPGPPSFAGSQIIVIQAHDVTITGITLDGDNPTLTPPGTLDARNGIITNSNNLGNWNNVRITDCIVRNIFWRGIFIVPNNSTSGHVVRNCTVEHVLGDAHSAAIMLAGATGEVVGNTVADASVGIAFWPGTTGSTTGGRFDSNTVTACDVAMMANNPSAPVQLGHNTIVGDGTGSTGIQVFMPLQANTIVANDISDCARGVAIHGGFNTRTQDVRDNQLAGTGGVNSVGVYLSTTIDDTLYADVDVLLGGNDITGYGNGIVLHESPGQTGRDMNVVVGGAPADSNSIHDHTLFGLLLDECNDAIMAQYNYWGVDCESVAGQVYEFDDDNSLGAVDYSNPYCTQECPVSITGDVNTDAVITASDIIYMVNYVFKAGPAPEPIPEAGDVNCSGTGDAADIIYMVNLVFKGGPYPCDICSIL